MALTVWIHLIGESFMFPVSNESLIFLLITVTLDTSCPPECGLLRHADLLPKSVLFPSTQKGI